VLTSADG
jgi:hypothetical protein